MKSRISSYKGYLLTKKDLKAAISNVKSLQEDLVKSSEIEDEQEMADYILATETKLNLAIDKRNHL